MTSGVNLDSADFLFLRPDSLPVAPASPWAGDSLSAFAVSGVRHAGVQGTALPYAVHTDSTLTIVLLACFVLTVAAAAWARRGASHYYLYILVPTGCMLIALAAFMMGSGLLPDYVVQEYHLAIVGLLFAAAMAFFVLKWCVCMVTNLILFDGKKSLQWHQSFLVGTAFEGIAMFPLVLLLVYFDWRADFAWIYVILVLFLNKMLSFYKDWSIFFKQKRAYLQFFLYFCALELTPLLAVCSECRVIINTIKVNY